MGRGKIEIKRIENSTNRQVTFTKRKNGIIKKAKEISVLCNAQVYLVLFSSSGKMAEFCSDNTTLSRMLEQHQKYTGNRIWDAKHERLNAEIDQIKKENDSMQIELRRLKGEDIAPLSPYELIPLEATLQRGLDSVREKQMEFLKKLKKNVGVFRKIARGGEQRTGHDPGRTRRSVQRRPERAAPVPSPSPGEQLLLPDALLFLRAADPARSR